MATKQLPGLTTLLPADSIDSTADLMLVRDTSTNADVKVKVGTVVGRDHGTAAGQVPLNSDLGTAATKNIGTAAGQVPLFSDVTALVASETAAGLIKIATTAQAQGLSDNSAALTALKLTQAFGGSNQSLVVNGYQRLPGGLIVQWGSVMVNTSNTAVTYPIAFPNAVLGVFMQNLTGIANVTLGVSGYSATGFNAICTAGGKSHCWLAIGK